MKVFRFVFCAVVSLLLAGCSDTGVKNEDGPAAENVPGNTEVIYEANPKVFARNRALDAISDRLEDIRDLGVTVLWLMPIYEIGEEKSIGSPYCVKDYYAVNPDFGTLDDLKALVDKAHGLGMKVILDWVANHTAWDNAWITVHEDWYTHDLAGNIVSPSGWTDVADLNFDNASMRAAMTDAMAYWITEAGIDGYRCDHAEGVPYDYWSAAIAELRTLKDGLIMLAEGGSAAVDLYASGFDIVYGWSFGDRLGEVFAGSASCSALYTANEEEFAITPAGKQRMRYSTNHDRTQESGTSPAVLYKTQDGAIAAFVTAAFMGGIPMIYSSQENGHLDSFDIFGYHIMDWDANPETTREYVDIMKVYRESAPLRGGAMKTYDTGDVISFHYQAADGRGLFVTVNTTGKEITFRTPMERSGESVRDMMSGDSSVLPSAITLPPYGYHIYETL